MKNCISIIALLFLAIVSYGQETSQYGSLSLKPSPVITLQTHNPNHSDTIPLGLKISYDRFLYDRLKEHRLPTEAFISDPWLMSAIGADLDPFIKQSQLLSLYDKNKWKLNGMVFAKREYVPAYIHSFVYMAGINSVYDDRFMFNARIAYGEDYMEYFAPSFTIGYKYNRFTFYTDYTKVIPMSSGRPKQTSDILDPEIIDGTKVGIDMEIKENLNLNVSKSFGDSGGTFVGIKVKR